MGRQEQVVTQAEDEEARGGAFGRQPPLGSPAWGQALSTQSEGCHPRELC